MLAWKADSNNFVAAMGSGVQADEELPLISFLRDTIFIASILRLGVLPADASLR